MRQLIRAEEPRLLDLATSSDLRTSCLEDAGANASSSSARRSRSQPPWRIKTKLLTTARAAQQTPETETQGREASVGAEAHAFRAPAVQLSRASLMNASAKAAAAAAPPLTPAATAPRHS
ncbi:hypothetical protein MTO96_001120 [Rhipicephalus appendiculatus]